MRVEFETLADTVSVGKDDVTVEFARRDGSRGTLRADYLVVAAGAKGSEALLSQLGVRTLTLPGTLGNSAYGLFEQRGEGRCRCRRGGHRLGAAFAGHRQRRRETLAVVGKDQCRAHQIADMGELGEIGGDQ